MDTSERLERAAQSIGDLFGEIAHFPTDELPKIGESLVAPEVGDAKQNTVPEFIQRVIAVHIRKHNAFVEAAGKNDYTAAQRFYNERMMLQSILLCFANAAMPKEFQQIVSVGIFCKNFMLVYRACPIMHAEESDIANAPIPSINRKKLH
jgi:hypothetical protein